MKKKLKNRMPKGVDAKAEQLHGKLFKRLAGVGGY